MSEELYEATSLYNLKDNNPKNPVANIFKNVWARVYLNIYGGDFTEDNGLTLKAALMQFFLPTTKRKLNWRHWLGASDPESRVNIFKAAFIILIDIGLFFPRLAINVAKLFTEVLPDMIAQLFLLANRKAKKGYKKVTGLSALGYALGFAVTGLFVGLFKFIYLIGCCLTSPIATSIRARNFNYKHDLLPKWLSESLENMSFLLAHMVVPATSFTCYFIILFLLASLIPGLGFVVALSGATLVGAVAAYIVLDHVLSNINRNPNGDDLFESHMTNIGPNQLRYCDRDVSKEILDSPENKDNFQAYEQVEQEIEETLAYRAPLFTRIEEIKEGPATPSSIPRLTPTMQGADEVD